MGHSDCFARVETFYSCWICFSNTVEPYATRFRIKYILYCIHGKWVYAYTAERMPFLSSSFFRSPFRRSLSLSLVSFVFRQLVLPTHSRANATIFTFIPRHLSTAMRSEFMSHTHLRDHLHSNQMPNEEPTMSAASHETFNQLFAHGNGRKQHQQQPWHFRNDCKFNIWIWFVLANGAAICASQISRSQRSCDARLKPRVCVYYILPWHRLNPQPQLIKICVRELIQIRMVFYYTASHTVSLLVINDRETLSLFIIIVRGCQWSPLCASNRTVLLGMSLAG